MFISLLALSLPSLLVARCRRSCSRPATVTRHYYRPCSRPSTTIKKYKKSSSCPSTGCPSTVIKKYSSPSRCKKIITKYRKPKTVIIKKERPRYAFWPFSSPRVYEEEVIVEEPIVEEVVIEESRKAPVDFGFSIEDGKPSFDLSIRP